MKELAIKDICIKGSSALKQKELLAIGKYPVYGASGISGYLNSYQQEKPYIGIVKDGSGIGRVDFYPEKTSLIGTMQYILPKNGYNIRYIGYCLQSLDLSKYKQGAAIPHIYFRDYGDRLVKVTEDINEQQHIVSRLDSTFAHIDTLKANAEKQLREARALFQKALERAMEPKEGWEEKKLGEIFVSINNGANIKQIKGAGGIPITRIETLSNDKFNRDRMGYADIQDVSPYASYILNDGDILMSHINSMKFLGRAVGYSKKDDEIIIHGMNLLRLIPTTDVFSPFMVYQFQTGFFRNQILQISHQSVNQASFNTTNLKGLKVIVPPLSDQQHIVARLDSLSANLREFENIQRKIIAECDALKQALLRKVFE